MTRKNEIRYRAAMRKKAIKIMHKLVKINAYVNKIIKDNYDVAYAIDGKVFDGTIKDEIDLPRIQQKLLKYSTKVMLSTITICDILSFVDAEVLQCILSEIYIAVPNIRFVMQSTMKQKDTD